RNSYSEEIDLLQAGNLSLVDATVFTDLAESKREERARFRELYIRALLFGEGPEISPISIVTPIRGDSEAFRLYLESLLRQRLIKERAKGVEVILVEDGIPAGAIS